jgi:alpha-L-rhamnosidase
MPRAWAIGAICLVSCTAQQDGIVLNALRVNEMREPISVDDPNPSFSWQVDAGGMRGVVTEGYELEVNRLHSNGSMSPVWTSGRVKSNQTQFIQWPEGTGAKLVSDADYSWQVRALVGAARTAWSKSTFSTSLLQQSDWDESVWIQSSNATGFATQMRKVFALEPGSVTRARAYVALPGFGSLWINGQKVDGRAGTRSLSQYDVRALYHTYDIQPWLQAGEDNAVGVSVGVGWFGHPAGGARFGPPTLRLLLRVQIDSGASTSSNGSDVSNIAVGTDITWLETAGPLQFEDVYNGSIYDARLETPGWTTPEYDHQSPAGNVSWTPLLASAQLPMFKLNNTILSAASMPAVSVIQSLRAKSMRMTAPGVYIFDFLQNLPGFCKLKITGRRGLRVQLRHAEVLQHPPYGPYDGNLLPNGPYDLRSAAATDVYILKGDANGESVDFSMSMHG